MVIRIALSALLIPSRNLLDFRALPTAITYEKIMACEASGQRIPQLKEATALSAADQEGVCQLTGWSPAQGHGPDCGSSVRQAESCDAEKRDEAHTL